MSIIIRFVKQIAFLLSPVKHSRYVFTSFAGHYSDSPKYICEAMHNLDPDAELVWLIDKQYAEQLPAWVKWADIGSVHAKWLKGSAKALVDNVYCDRGYIVCGKKRITRIKGKLFCLKNNKRGQFAFSTWHGTPLKRMGRDMVENNVSDFLCAPLTLVLNNNYTADIMQRLTFDRTKVICLGLPRNDILFRPELRKNIKEKLGLPEEKKIILFAPTFRDNENGIGDKNLRRSGIEQLEQIDFTVLFDTLSRKFGGEWIMICRFHYHVERMVNWKKIDGRYPGKIINGNAHDDMSEYLLCADALVTDASSCMFDYALTRRPVFLFFPDLEYYEEQERGFYLHLSELPFPVAQYFDELIHNIKAFDVKSYENDVSSLLTNLGNADDGHASERIAKYILQECSKKTYLDKTMNCHR